MTLLQGLMMDISTSKRDLIIEDQWEYRITG